MELLTRAVEEKEAVAVARHVQELTRQKLSISNAKKQMVRTAAASAESASLARQLAKQQTQPLASVATSSVEVPWKAAVIQKLTP